MAKHQESAAKQAIRGLLLDASESLQRGKLTYLGLPSEKALDVRTLEPVLENVICVEENKTILDEARRSIAPMPFKVRRFENFRMWEYLRDKYPAEPLVADIAFLDFYGGGIVHEDPFALEIAGLRSFFAKHANSQNKTFILGWTYMPRDKGPGVYLRACEKIIPSGELDLLRRSSGMWARSVAIRLLLRQSCDEHRMLAKIFHHAVFKNVMNAIVLVFSKGFDSKCKISLEDPKALLDAPVCVYDPKSTVPKMLPFPSLK